MVRTDKLPTRENQNGFFFARPQEPWKGNQHPLGVSRAFPLALLTALWQVTGQHPLLTTLCCLQPHFSMTSQVTVLGTRVPDAVPHSLMLYHILYWLLGTLVRVTRWGYRKSEKDPFSEGIRCYWEKKRLIAIQHNGCDASSEAGALKQCTQTRDLTPGKTAWGGMYRGQTKAAPQGVIHHEWQWLCIRKSLATGMKQRPCLFTA